MAKNEAQKQKKLAKKKSRDNEKRKLAAQQKNRMSSFAGQWESALRGEFDRVWISSDLGEFGIGQVIVTRRMSDGRVAIVRFLIDSYCLGVKDVSVVFDYPTRAVDIVEYLESRNQNFRTDVTAADAAKVVLGAVQYARSLGLEPDSTYTRVANLFDDVDPLAAKFELEFGRNGKPLYIPGPNENPVFLEELKEKIRASGTELEVDFTTLLSEYDALEDPELDADIDEDIDPMLMDSYAESATSDPSKENE
jgi:hypothetical protein